MAYNPTINDIKDITPLLSSRLQFDYTNFGFTFLKRRLSHLFSILNIKKLQQFIDGIENGSLLDDVKYHFPVTTTELFRDPSFWRTLATKIDKYTCDQSLSFWFPELSSPEELYSLLILLAETNNDQDYKVICNIDNKKRKEEILSGFLPTKKNRELNKQNLKRVNPIFTEETFFYELNGCLFLNKKLLNNVQIIDGNFFTQAPPKNSVFMAMYRNIMLNFNTKLQSIAEREISHSLQPDGFLSIGIKEHISSENDNLYTLFDENESIYKKIK